MTEGITSHRLLEQEVHGLLARLARVQSFALHDSSVPAAAISTLAQAAIEQSMAEARGDVQEQARAYLHWLKGPVGQAAPARVAHRRFRFLRLRFNATLSRFDIFSDVLTQRSEQQTGVWLSGLDALAADALALPGHYRSPPVICYLDRGAGAAIRRARTRLPGGGENPVAIVRVPRERMVGSGVGSSLVHEVGHQAAALLDLVRSLQRGLQRLRAREWRYWERWISEIVADFWSVARVGIGSTLGLMGVVSLPDAFVFRVNLQDPHPFPWIRVKLSCAMGHALYPHSQWERSARLWEEFYARGRLDPERAQLISQLEAHLPVFVSFLTNHRLAALHGRALPDVLSLEQRQPNRLMRLWRQWQTNPAGLYSAQPTLAFAVIGQAKADDVIEPEAETNLIGKLLNHWALRNTLDASALCAEAARRPAKALAA